jgi:hypothetical protein
VLDLRAMRRQAETLVHALETDRPVQDG